LFLVVSLVVVLLTCVLPKGFMIFCTIKCWEKS